MTDNILRLMAEGDNFLVAMLTTACIMYLLSLYSVLYVVRDLHTKTAEIIKEIIALIERVANELSGD